MTLEIEPLDYIEKTAFQERKAIIDKVNEIIDEIGPVIELQQDAVPTAGHGEGYYVTSEGVKVYVDNGDAAEATARQSADATEASARQSADTTLQNNITAEASARGVADSNLQANIDAEASARALGDTTVQTNLNTEISDRQAAVTAEASARQSADAVLQTNIDTEASTRVGVDARLQQSIDAISVRVDTEVSNRQAADTTLQNNIDSEAVLRNTGDTELLNRINLKQDALSAGDGIAIENNVIKSFTQVTSDQTQLGSASLLFICLNSSNLVFSGVCQRDGVLLAGFGITNVQNSWMQVFVGPGDYFGAQSITLHLDNDNQTTIPFDPTIGIEHIYSLIGEVYS